MRGQHAVETLLWLEGRFRYILPSGPGALSVLGPEIPTVKAKSDTARFECNNKVMNASRILRTIRFAQLTGHPTRVITTLFA